MCYVWPRSRVNRSGRYAVNKALYNKGVWPPFCSGSGYVMSMDVARILFELAMYDPMPDVIHLDDPYVTGILADKVDLKHVAINNKYLLYGDVRKHYKATNAHEYIFWHINDVHQNLLGSKERLHQMLWQKFLDRHVSIQTS